MAKTKVEILWKPTAKQLGQFADDYYQELNEAMTAITNEVITRAEAKAPVGPTGDLKSSIRSSVLKTGGRVMVGYKVRVPYGAKVHWGAKSPQDPKDWFLFNTVYPQATKQNSGPVAEWIGQRINEFVQKAVKKYELK